MSLKCESNVGSVHIMSYLNIYLSVTNYIYKYFTIVHFCIKYLHFTWLFPFYATLISMLEADIVLLMTSY